MSDPSELENDSSRPAPQKRSATLTALRWLVALGLCFILFGWGWYRWTYPYGHRACAMACMWMSLQMYAERCDGWYPEGGKTPLESLQILYKLQPGSPSLFAGVTGPEEETRIRLESGGVLDESVSSWVYIPGLRKGDDEILRQSGRERKYGLAVLWERQSGISGNGSRTERGSHVVALLNNPQQLIRGADWEPFLKEQEEYRRIVFASRGVLTGTNPVPSPR